MMIITANNHHYYIEIAGIGQPIVLLHGFTGSVASWHSLLEKLSENYQVIVIDILGQGKSDKPMNVTAYQMESIASDIAELIQISPTQINLLGYSMGGRLALYIALKYPELIKSLILESSSPGLASEIERDERRKNDNELADKIEQNGMEWFVDYWEKLPLWKSQLKLSFGVLQAQRDQRLQNDPLGLANSLRGMGTGVQPNLWGELENLKMPVQLIVGEEDTKFVAINQQMHQQLADSQLAIIPDAGHTVHLEQADLFVDTVLKFLGN